MRKFPRLLIASVMVFSLLIPITHTYSADYNDYEDKPRRTSMCSIFKTALVGIGLLAAPTPVSPCHVGNMKHGSNSDVTQIVSLPCSNHVPRYHAPYVNISMSIGVGQSPSGNIPYSEILGIRLCSTRFNVRYLYEGAWDTNPYHHDDYDFYTGSFNNPIAGGEDNDKFMRTFNHVLDTGSCPPTPQPASRRLLEKRDEESIRKDT